MTFSKNLITWYHHNKRTLPFRSQCDPYKIWVSEIMAQQTQIATMIPYYERWIKIYPDVFSLAQANIEDILKMWEGLGYYNRARNLHKGAQYVVTHFNGILPANKEKLMEIPGIGDYTSSAIASIAFGLPEIVIDGNVKRVAARFLNYTENVNAKKAHRTFETFLKNEMIKNNEDPNAFNQALMELGALVCKPKNPDCNNCPLQVDCLYGRGETIEDIPYIPKPKPTPIYKKTVYIVVKDDLIMISDESDDGLMKGLYRLPMIDGHIKGSADITLIHKFSHLQWDIKAFQVDQLDINDHSWFFVPIKDIIDVYPIVTAHRKLLIKLKII